MRIALFVAQLLIISILLHRFTGLPTPVTTNLIVTSLIGAALAILLAILAFAQIWQTGIKGTGIALTALLVSLAIFAVPLYHLPSLLKLPAINDITTDLLSPPQFLQVAALRGAQANSVIYPGNQFISAQARSYPDISTLTLERSNRDSFELVHGVIEDLGWKIVGERQPSKRSRTGYIEAVDRSLILGFQDDVVVRVRGNNRTTRIDMRSSSRYGRHDLGTNASRIREMFSSIKNRIAHAEAQRIDILERKRIAKESQIARKKKDRERKRRERADKKKQGPIILPKAQFNTIGVANPDNPGGIDPVTGEFLAPSPNISPQKARKLRRIERRRKRKRKKWVPFNTWP